MNNDGCSFPYAHFSYMIKDPLRIEDVQSRIEDYSNNGQLV